MQEANRELKERDVKLVFVGVCWVYDQMVDVASIKVNDVSHFLKALQRRAELKGIRIRRKSVKT